MNEREEMPQRREAAMKQKTRNALALIAIVIYIVITMANPENPMIRYYALLEVF